MRLRQIDWLPDPAPRAAAVVVHGHGDHAERHAATVRPLLERGIACSALDLPGHGRSPGARGQLPGFATVSRILAAARDAFERRCGMATAGWVAHSMGGLLTLHHLADPGTPVPRFLWLSSPLLDPGAGRSTAARALTHALGGLVPCFPLRTGVRRSDCSCDDQADQPAPDPAGDLGHDRISLGWARELLRLGRSLPAAIGRLDGSIRTLFTQGLDDPVCPATIARRVFDRLPLESKRWVGLPGARHEPFADAHIESLHRKVAGWLDEQVLPLL
jgi:alpha-beta hydrolase superfamily lysophospholipase